MKAVKQPIRINRECSEILVSKPFLAKANIVGTMEFDALEKVRASYPSYTVKARTIAKSNKKRPHLKVSYAYMEKYIKLHEKAEERMAEYREMRLRAECQMATFADVKKWFVALYPEIDDFTPEEFKEFQEANSDDRFFETREEASAVSAALPLAG